MVYKQDHMLKKCHRSIAFFCLLHMLKQRSLDVTSCCDVYLINLANRVDTVDEYMFHAMVLIDLTLHHLSSPPVRVCKHGNELTAILCINPFTVYVMMGSVSLIDGIWRKEY